MVYIIREKYPEKSREEGDIIGLSFCSDKSGVMVLNDEKRKLLETEDVVKERIKNTHIEKYGTMSEGNI